MTRCVTRAKINYRAKFQAQGSPTSPDKEALVPQDTLREHDAGITHLPELLVDHTKLECVVDFVFIVRHYHLGRLE